jgi:hypothetical protein
MIMHGTEFKEMHAHDLFRCLAVIYMIKKDAVMERSER